MKKIILISGFIFFILNILFANQYKIEVVTGKNSYSYTGNEISKIQENKILSIVYTSSSFSREKDNFPSIKDDSENWYLINDIKPKNTESLFDESLISYGSSEDKVLYLPDYFVEALKTKKYKILEQYNVFFDQFMSDEYYVDINRYLTHETSYYPVISNVMFGFMTREHILITNIKKKNKTTYICDCINSGSAGFDPEDYENNMFYFVLLDYEPGEKMTVEVKIDGDYITLTELNKNKVISTLVKVDQSFIDQCVNLFADKTVDLSKVTWPRHADGTCDYDNSKATAKTISANQPSPSAPTTNVAVKKLMTTNCNLKLRAAEATSSNVLTVMAQGTKVKILELGKAETIDGISSNWVEVEVQKGSKDRDGKPIAPRTTGWCYGGYLE